MGEDPRVQSQRGVEVGGKRAVVLAGGLGTRLQPYTAVLPKPLMPVGDRPVLDVVIRQLRHHGFDRVTIATGHLAELIEAFFGDGSRFGVTIDYFRETTPLGTVGALASIAELGDDFLVMNGDILTDMNYGELLDAHRATEALATIAVKRRSLQISLGVLHFDDDAHQQRVVAYEEKPVFEFDASMGVYCFSPAVLEYIESDVRLDFPDLVQRLLAAGQVVHGRPFDGYWLDIGRHEDFQRATDEFEEMRGRLIPGE
jgi:NDP-sugar pyrophosphorylase family protein